MGVHGAINGAVNGAVACLVLVNPVAELARSLFMVSFNLFNSDIVLPFNTIRLCVKVADFGGRKRPSSARTIPKVTKVQKEKIERENRENKGSSE